MGQMRTTKLGRTLRHVRAVWAARVLACLQFKLRVSDQKAKNTAECQPRHGGKQFPGRPSSATFVFAVCSVFWMTFFLKIPRVCRVTHLNRWLSRKDFFQLHCCL